MTDEPRPWTHKAVESVEVEVYQGAYFRFTRDIKAAAEELARDLRKLFEEHADWRGTDVIVHAKTVTVCNYCKLPYEEDAEGPACCDAALGAWIELGPKEPSEELARRYDRDGREQKALEEHVQEIEKENRTRYAYETEAPK